MCVRWCTEGMSPCIEAKGGVGGRGRGRGWGWGKQQVNRAGTEVEWEGGGIMNTFTAKLPPSHYTKLAPLNTLASVVVVDDD